MKRIACIVKGYPRLSETFIAQEIRALEKAGVDVIIYSLRHPTDFLIHPIHKEIDAKVHYLPEYLYQHPLRVMGAFFFSLVKGKIFFDALKIFIKDFSRDFSTNRGRRFGQALVLAKEISPDREWLYVHFLHTPASVARYASHLLDLPWSCSAHAKDIWTSPQWEIREKLDSLNWLVSCTATNVKYLQKLCDDRQKVKLLYHGLDLAKFPEPTKKPRFDGSSENNMVSILSVGRCVNKKGFDILLDALEKLPPHLYWQFTHIGGGPLEEDLKDQARNKQIKRNIIWLGPQRFDRVIIQYQKSDIFVLASRIDENGDRDGLPNVLMEAMSQGLCCISTNISAIPELIENQVNGILVEPENSELLSEAIEALIISPEQRTKLGLMGNQVVNEKYSLESNIQPLIERFS